MTNQKLQELLQKFPPDAAVMILDRSNGGGNPRDLNFGPIPRSIEQEDADDVGDCEGRVGEVVVLLGFGCY